MSRKISEYFSSVPKISKFDPREEKFKTKAEKEMNFLHEDKKSSKLDENSSNLFKIRECCVVLEDIMDQPNKKLKTSEKIQFDNLQKVEDKTAKMKRTQKINNLSAILMERFLKPNLTFTVTCYFICCRSPALNLIED